MKTDNARKIVLDLFREETLILAGLCTVYEVPDNFVRKAMKNLEVLMERYVRRIGQQHPKSTNWVPPKRKGVPHPAVASMLSEIERYRSESLQTTRDNARISDD